MALPSIAGGVFARRVATLLTGSRPRAGHSDPRLAAADADVRSGGDGTAWAVRGGFDDIGNYIRRCATRTRSSLPRQSDEAAALVVLGASLSIGLSLLAAAAWWRRSGVPYSSGVGPSGRPLDLDPLGAAALGVFQVLNAWQVRCQRFRMLAVAKVAQSLAMTSIQLGAGFVALCAAASVVASCWWQLAGIAVLSRSLGRAFVDRTRITLAALLLGAKRYRRFPGVFAARRLINVLVNQLRFF